MKSYAAVLAALLLAGCAAPKKDPDAAARAAADRKLGDAVVAPLTDLNLVRDPIPPVLESAQKAPYATPADLSCAALAAEVELLDAALGADLDAARSTAEATLMERGAEEASDAVISAVRNTTEGVIPFRGWVRKLTGADRYAKEVAAAIAAGKVRRAFLKGLGQAGACTYPAAPKRGPQAEAAAGPPAEAAAGPPAPALEH